MAHSAVRLAISVLLAIVCAGGPFWSLERPRAQAHPLILVRTYPSGVAPCNTTLQACVSGSADGDIVQIAAGTYVTSVTLDKAVSLLGAGAASTTLSALTNQRVITVTGAGITHSTVISGLSIANGNALSQGGGMLVTGGA
jgi:hypothetical protein